MSTRCDHELDTVSAPVSPLSALTTASRLNALLAWDSLVFAAICLADMLTTLYWIHAGRATEANPWLAACLARGTFYFCAAKLVSFVPMLLIAAYYRGEYPRFVPLALRLGAAMYLTVYCIGVGVQFFSMR